MASLKSHRSVKNLRTFWPATNMRPASSSADQGATTADQDLVPAALVQYPSDSITGVEQPQPRNSLVILPLILLDSNVFSGLEMSASATVRFARPGVRAPVFIVTSASAPPWEAIEMLDSGERTASGEIIFQRTFDDIAHGAHQYKIRIGQDQWILDEDKETATDESGNRNNVIHSELKFNQRVPPVPEEVAGAASQHPDDPMQVEANTTFQYPHAKDELEPQWREDRQDSVHPPHAPFPTVVIDNLPKQGSAASGDTERQGQEVNTFAPVASVEGNANSILSQSYVQSGTEEKRHAPLFGHESSDLERPTRDSPSGSPTNITQKQFCDSSTDQSVSETDIVTPPEDELSNGPHLPHEINERQEYPHDEFDNAPRLPHEVDSGSEGGRPTSGEDELANAPLMSHEMGPNVDRQDADEVADELGNAPLMSHGIELSAQSPSANESSGMEHAPPMARELGGFYDREDESTSPSEHFSDFDSTPSAPSERALSRPWVGGRDNHRHLSPEQKSAFKKRRRGMIINTTPLSSGDGASELGQAPLLSHEAGPSPQSETFDDPVSELDRAPLMSHEADASGSCFKDASTADDAHLAPVFSNESAAAEPNGGDSNDDNEAPLLPHERPSPVIGLSNREYFHETGQLPAVSYQRPNSPPVFTRHTSSSLWKVRSHSSSLPHSLPRSDDEDENLNDPFLEHFPTQRQHIFERVATIGHHLPEDETIPSPGGVHSPAVISQACSSVDLVPVGSHTSLQRINEDALMEGDEGEEEDVALGSPAMELSFAPNDEAGALSDVPALNGIAVTDDFLTPMPHRRRGNYFDLDSEQEENGREQEDDKKQNDAQEQGFGTSEADERTLVGSVYGNDGVGENDMFAPAARRRWTPGALARPASALDPILTTPTTPERRQLFPWEFEDQQRSTSESSQRLADIQQADGSPPIVQHVYRSPLYLRAWRRLFA